MSSFARFIRKAWKILLSGKFSLFLTLDDAHVYVEYEGGDNPLDEFWRLKILMQAMKVSITEGKGEQGR